MGEAFMKKFVAMLLAAIMLLSVVSTSALAEIGPKGKKDVKIELKHEKKAEKPDEKAGKQAEKELKKLQQMVDKANREIEKLVRHAQKTPHNDIDWLQAQVARVTAPVFSYAASIGAVVECTYTTYYIDGQYVDVDPLRVINIVDRK